MTNLTSEEINRLLAVVTKPQHRAFIMLSYYHGMRRGELLCLTREDFCDGQVLIHRLKRRKPFAHVQPLHPKELATVMDMLSLMPADQIRCFPWKGPATSNMMRAYLEKAGVYTYAYQKSLHSLRHSCGKTIYDACDKLENVADYLGHTNLNSSRRYIHLDEKVLHAIAAKAL